MKHLSALLPPELQDADADADADAGAPTRGGVEVPVQGAAARQGAGGLGDARGGAAPAVYLCGVDAVAAVVGDRVVTWDVVRRVDAEQRALWLAAEEEAAAAAAAAAVASVAAAAADATPPAHHSALLRGHVQVPPPAPPQPSGLFTFADLAWSFVAGLLLTLCAVAVAHYAVLLLALDALLFKK